FIIQWNDSERDMYSHFGHAERNSLAGINQRGSFAVPSPACQFCPSAGQVTCILGSAQTVSDHAKTPCSIRVSSSSSKAIPKTLSSNSLGFMFPKATFLVASQESKLSLSPNISTPLWYNKA